MKIAILLPSKGETKTKTMNCIIETFVRLHDAGMSFRLIFAEGTLVPHVRNKLIDAVIKDKEITHAVFIDSDMIFDPDWILEMVKSKHKVMTGVARCRGTKTVNVFRYVRSAGLYTTLGEEELVGDQELPIDSVGMSFLMFRREVIEKCLEYKQSIADYFKRQLAEVSSPALKRACKTLANDTSLFNSVGQKSEDMIFCEMMRDCNYEIILNTKYKLGHLVEEELTV